MNELRFFPKWLSRLRPSAVNAKERSRILIYGVNSLRRQLIVCRIGYRFEGGSRKGKLRKSARRDGKTSAQKGNDEYESELFREKGEYGSRPR